MRKARAALEHILGTPLHVPQSVPGIQQSDLPFWARFDDVPPRPQSQNEESFPIYKFTPPAINPNGVSPVANGDGGQPQGASSTDMEHPSLQSLPPRAQNGLNRDDAAPVPSVSNVNLQLESKNDQAASDDNNAPLPEIVNEGKQEKPDDEGWVERTDNIKEGKQERAVFDGLNTDNIPSIRPEQATTLETANAAKREVNTHDLQADQMEYIKDGKREREDFAALNIGNVPSAIPSQQTERANTQSGTSSESEPARAVDETLDAYYRGSTLGGGAFSKAVALYREGKKAAIAKVPKTLDQQAFNKEAQMHALVGDHPNIAPYLGIVEDLPEKNGPGSDGTAMVVGYVDGTTLENMLWNLENLGVTKEQRISMARVIGRDMLSALAYMKDKGVAHRDLNPGNIMISKDGQAKIIDFGLAHQPGDAKATKEPIPIGHLIVPPEQLESLDDGKPFGEDLFASDVFAVGAQLYRLVTGQQFQYHAPYKIVDAQTRVSAVREYGKFADASRQKTLKELDALGIDDELAKLMASMLDPSSDIRPSAAALLKATFFAEDKDRDEAARNRLGSGGEIVSALPPDAPAMTNPSEGTPQSQILPGNAFYTDERKSENHALPNANSGAAPASPSQRQCAYYPGD
jgi:serine/threonine protein kinase